MFVCDLCRKQLVKGKNKWVVIEKNGIEQHVCEDCIILCKEIVKDPNTGSLTYLNEYKEKKEMARV